ncbi:hypothetical protein P7C73_g5706, partial [Tremellales sp. Uapishka_1]
MRVATVVLSLLFVPSLLAATVQPRAGAPKVTSTPKVTKTCPNDPTRVTKNCQCLPGFDDPGTIKKQCFCPDEENTRLVYDTTGSGKNKATTASCVCEGGAQYFDVAAKRCGCSAPYEPVYNNKGVLRCVLPPKTSTKKVKTTTTKTSSSTSSTWSSTSTSHSATPTPSGAYKRSIPTLDEAVKMGDGELEAVLSCQVGEKACEKDGSWSCTDIMSSLSHCGGCEGTAVDCGAIPGVGDVSCTQGRCVIDTCQRGYEIRSLDLPSNSTIPAAECAPRHKTKWLNIQT